MTVLYLIRHSKPLKVNNSCNNDELQIQNEKSCLSIEGEIIAKQKLNKPEFDNIDVLYSSNYVRTIQTAKYLAVRNDIEKRPGRFRRKKIWSFFLGGVTQKF